MKGSKMRNINILFGFRSERREIVNKFWTACVWQGVGELCKPMQRSQIQEEFLYLRNIHECFVFSLEIIPLIRAKNSSRCMCGGSKHTELIIFKAALSNELSAADWSSELSFNSMHQRFFESHQNVCLCNQLLIKSAGSVQV